MAFGLRTAGKAVTTWIGAAVGSTIAAIGVLNIMGRLHANDEESLDYNDKALLNGMKDENFASRQAGYMLLGLNSLTQEKSKAAMTLDGRVDEVDTDIELKKGKAAFVGIATLAGMVGGGAMGWKAGPKLNPDDNLPTQATGEGERLSQPHITQQ